MTTWPDRKRASETYPSKAAPIMPIATSHSGSFSQRGSSVETAGMRRQIVGIADFVGGITGAAAAGPPPLDDEGGQQQRDQQGREGNTGQEALRDRHRQRREDDVVELFEDEVDRIDAGDQQDEPADAGRARVRQLEQPPFRPARRQQCRGQRGDDTERNDGVQRRHHQPAHPQIEQIEMIQRRDTATPCRRSTAAPAPAPPRPPSLPAQKTSARRHWHCDSGE